MLITRDSVVKTCESISSFLLWTRIRRRPVCCRNSTGRSAGKLWPFLRRVSRVHTLLASRPEWRMWRNRRLSVDRSPARAPIKRGRPAPETCLICVRRPPDALQRDADADIDADVDLLQSTTYVQWQLRELREHETVRIPTVIAIRMALSN